jgi:hypothetical protein
MRIGIAVLLTLLGLGAPPSDVYTMRTRHLVIPIHVNEAKRAELNELQLFVSLDLGKTWTLAGRENPNQESFKFHAQNDGQYWFGVLAIDKAGNRDPAEVSACLKVLIDTVTPVVRIVAADRVGDEIQLAWETLDVQAEAASLQLDYRLADSGPNPYWQRLPVVPMLSGQTRFRPLSNGPITVRVQINDSTGTPAMAVKEITGAAAASVTANSVAPPIMAAATAPVPPPGAFQQANSIAPVPSIAPTTSAVPSTAPTAPLAVSDTAPMPTAIAPVPPAPSPVTQPPAEAPSNLAPLPSRAGADGGGRVPMASSVNDYGNASTSPARGPLPDVVHVRDRQAAVDFEVASKGPSGVKRIQVFMTQNDGQTWTPYFETPPNQTTSPLPLMLPVEEGLYGFRLVLFSGADQSVGPPRTGDAPEFRVQVDRTAPRVSLFAPTIVPGQPNALALHYLAKDEHLDPRSISLFWSTQPNDGWRPIALSGERESSLRIKDVKECTWSLPADLPDRVYLRLTACDLAGNLGECVTRDPVTVDLHKPTAKVKGIAGIGK